MHVSHVCSFCCCYFLCLFICLRLINSEWIIIILLNIFAVTAHSCDEIKQIVCMGTVFVNIYWYVDCVCSLKIN